MTFKHPARIRFLAVVVFFGGLFFWQYEIQRKAERDMPASERPFLARLSGFSYRPCEPPTFVDPESGPAWKPFCPGAQRSRPLGSLSSAPRDLDLHARSIRLLISLAWKSRRREPSEPSGLQEIAASLESALRQDPSNPELLNDAAAVHFSLSLQEGDPRLALTALKLLRRATDLDSSFPEAHFNRALVLQHLGTGRAALEAWEDFLTLDSRSSWASEARSLSSQLTRTSRASSTGRNRPALDDPRAIREYILFELLPAWASQEIQSPSGEKILRESRSLSRTLVSQGETLTAAAVELAEQLQAGGAIEDSPRVREGIVLLAEGRRLAYASREGSAEAREVLNRARELLFNAPPLLAWVDFFIAFSYGDDEITAAVEMLAELEASGVTARSPGLGGDIQRLLGRSAIVRGDPVTALAHYDQARSRYDSAREPGYGLLTDALAAECLEMLGREKKTWQRLHSALQGALAIDSADYRAFVFLSAADASLFRGDPESALLFQNEAIAIAERSADPLVLADALIWRAVIQIELNDPGLAERDLDLAANSLDRAALRPGSRRLKALAQLARAELALDQKPADAVVWISEAIEAFDALDRRLLSLLARLSRAQAQIHLGDLTLAEQDLLAALELFETAGAPAKGEDRRLLFTGRLRELYDQTIDFYWSERGQPDRALEIAERAHLHNLPLAGTGNLESRAPTASKLKAAVPERVAMVSSAVLSDKLLLWLIQDGEIQAFDLPVPERELLELVDQFWQKTTAAHPSWLEASERLYRYLIEPLAPHLAETDKIAWIPDKVFHELSLAGLRNPATGRFLVQDFVLTTLPSASDRVRGKTPEVDRFPSQDPSGSQALVMGDPAFSERHFPGLPRLPAANAEARQIAQILGTTALVSGDASKEAFLLRAPGAPIVHFSGHADYRASDPRYSGLLLTPASQKESGVLYAWEVYPHDFAGTEFLFLAACQSGATAPRGAGGLAGLARAFLAAGVAQILVTLRPIEDAATSPLVKSFYHFYLREQDAATSLQAAIREEIKTGNAALASPPVWAAFQVISGVHEPQR